MENFSRNPDPHFNRMLQALDVGRVIAFRGFPLHSDPQDALVAAVRASADSLFILDDRLAELTNTPNLPPSEILRVREDANAAFVGTQVRLASAKAAMEAARAALESDERAFYEPSPVGETVALLTDIEMRATFNAADPSERDSLWQKMAQGEQRELLAALGRFGFGSVAERARVVYRALAAERAPDRVRAFALESERLSWAESTLGLLVAALDSGTMLTGAQTAVALH